jgi:hypothetical protein
MSNEEKQVSATRGPVSLQIMFQEFARFLESPSRATYLAARSAWLRLGVQPLHPAELQDLAERLANDDAAGVIKEVHGWQSRAALSPRAHFLAAAAHDRLSQTEQGDLERWVFSTCLQGILATGDGSRRKPYVIAQLTDEQDVLKLQGFESIQQELTPRGRRTCDVLTGADGRELWFDVSELVQVPIELAARRSKQTLRKAAVSRTTRRTSDRLRTAPR